MSKINDVLKKAVARGRKNKEENPDQLKNLLNLLDDSDPSLAAVSNKDCAAADVPMIVPDEAPETAIPCEPIEVLDGIQSRLALEMQKLSEEKHRQSAAVSQKKEALEASFARMRQNVERGEFADVFQELESISGSMGPDAHLNEKIDSLGRLYRDYLEAVRGARPEPADEQFILEFSSQLDGQFDRLRGFLAEDNGVKKEKSFIWIFALGAVLAVLAMGFFAIRRQERRLEAQHSSRLAAMSAAYQMKLARVDSERTEFLKKFDVVKKESQAKIDEVTERLTQQLATVKAESGRTVSGLEKRLKEYDQSTKKLNAEIRKLREDVKTKDSIISEFALNLTTAESTHEDAEIPARLKK
jgi:vacuolar-type H+-ATPase subunit I/STV1